MTPTSLDDGHEMDEAKWREVIRAEVSAAIKEATPTVAAAFTAALSGTARISTARARTTPGRSVKPDTEQPIPGIVAGAGGGGGGAAGAAHLPGVREAVEVWEVGQAALRSSTAERQLGELRNKIRKLAADFAADFRIPMTFTPEFYQQSERAVNALAEILGEPPAPMPDGG